MQQIELVQDNSNQDAEQKVFTLKIPYTASDEFGNTAQFFRKEIVTVGGLTAQKADLQAQMDLIDIKIGLIK